MKSTFAMGIALAALLTVPAAAQMMHGGADMGGGRRTMINLVSPADSPTQVRRGVLMIGQYMSMMQTPAAPGGQASAPRVWLLLRLYGVSDSAGLVTNAGNRLLFDGRLATASDGEAPITIDQQFALTNGGAFVQVQVPVPPLTDSARILIDQIAVLDSAGDTFAVPGVVIASPIASATPAPTPAARCTRDSECDDHNPETRDVCMPVGCVHMPGHMGGGPMM
jgi:hypothetical protein